MQWSQISENWEAFTPAILDRWPEAQEDDVLALDGSATALAVYLSEVTGESSRDTLAQIEDWRMGRIPTDVAMDETLDNEHIQESERHLDDGEDPSDRDDLFGDDNTPSPAVGRT
ncbi:hypothetical protein OB2597_03367 [Pseudooceanicola batsensis HTCC2597]|uniref:Uncharacterized protein n=1 Tax=Pseudooceanicola batsensis (strain ATCC BAA-863 / DSM 15984 / KCTC 12145 / HTCC2597) TaxID=252305 RepID=A3TXR7_PSEBH|nr:hypothetical protein [Pseudooceanicola batsensis]EAQ03627.1 hypothetical protein OB2597_03367 [Pseudooceanicola batsensis HTCC2597]